MSTAAKKIITVFGATGGQGGSVVTAILSNTKAAAQFQIRAVTRDVSKPSAKALTDQGCEVVSADLNNKSDVVRALQGAYGAFAVTNFWEKGDPEVEFQQGKNVADAAKETGVQHLIWSSLINVTEVSKGVLSKVSHFDSKARVEAYIRTLGINATFFRPGYYMSNLVSSIHPTGTPKTYVLPLPFPPTTTPIPLFDTRSDTGKFARSIFTAGARTFGKTYNAAVTFATPEEIVREWSEVTGAQATAVRVEGEAWKQGILPYVGSEKAAEELLQNMRLMAEFGYFGGEGLEGNEEILDEPLTTWKEFVAKQENWKNL